MSTSKSRVARRTAASVAATAIAGLALAGPALADSGSSGNTFVIGDQSNLALGSEVSFWGAQWSQQNPLSTGSAPHAFKGYADNVSGSCGGSWTSRPGNSSNPPASLSGTVNVIVSSAISKSGSVISGDIQAIAVVAPDPGYAGDPGHPGTGTIVGYVCGGPAGTSSGTTPTGGDPGSGGGSTPTGSQTGGSTSSTTGNGNGYGVTGTPAGGNSGGGSSSTPPPQMLT